MYSGVYRTACLKAAVAQEVKCVICLSHAEIYVGKTPSVLLPICSSECDGMNVCDRVSKTYSRKVIYMCVRVHACVRACVIILRKFI